MKKEKALGERAEETEERREAREYWEKQDREERIAFWKEVGWSALVSFIASLAINLILAYYFP